MSGTGTGGGAEAALDAVSADLALRPADWPVLLAGPTASGKSALALAVGARHGGTIVNADALQVWSVWRILTARPSPADEAAAPHALYGHVPPGEAYSAGRWLREAGAVLAALGAKGERVIVTGGTGLYLSALTEGLAEIPPTPPEVRAEATARVAAEGPGALLAELDDATAARIDRRNPARVMRAWEVLRTTGEGLAAWQDRTGPPLLPPAAASAFVLHADRDRLAARIDRRFTAMVGAGAIAEVRAASGIWDPSAPWAQAIGARELIAHLAGETDLAAAVTLAQAATRQYAKRQRTWFRARMRKWRQLPAP
ncbi:MAG: tRNA (adenosine(37)-N6)-dimethylallyltransferase MiaA [Paracoccaceae bacterium]